MLLSWSNRKLRRLILPGNAQNQSQPTTELTADQLAGTINNGAANANTTAPQPAARTRRTRRPRRTPSQMSVTSLPAYNKEPGEQELVIFRCVRASIRISFLHIPTLNTVARTWRMSRYRHPRFLKKMATALYTLVIGPRSIPRFQTIPRSRAKAKNSVPLVQTREGVLEITICLIPQRNLQG